MRPATHWQGILNAFDSRLSNGVVEGMNAQIQAAKARVRGFHTTRNLITVCYLVGGKLPICRRHPTAQHVGQRLLELMNESPTQIETAP